MIRCTRFHRDGAACTHTTDHVDGWCRHPDCPGFVRPDTSRAPTTHGAPRGAATHLRASPAVPVGLAIDDIPTVHVTAWAVDSFRFHHGGDRRSAEAQLRAMLEDFLLTSARQLSPTGFVRLSRQGYALVLSPDHGAITAYSTVHRERTWEQIKHGIPSRFPRHRPPRPSSESPREAGPAVPLAEFADVFDAAALYLTARVQRSYAKISNLLDASDEDLDAAIRASAAHLPSGTIVQREDGLFEVEHAECIWLVAPDCQALIGVKPAPRPKPVTAGPDLPDTPPSAAAR
ncbi:hypothetical protein ACWECW_18385 [Rhodococcus ruber]